jgi:hypothetical protein
MVSRCSHAGKEQHFTISLSARRIVIQGNQLHISNKNNLVTYTELSK